MAMAATRFLIRTATASRNPVFRLMSARTQATSAAPATGTATDMLFTFASPSEVNYCDFENKTKDVLSTCTFVFVGILYSSKECASS
jgi:adenosylcobinamide amidohydrolase